MFASQLQLLWESMFVHWTSAGETRPEAGLEDSGWAKEHVKKSLVSRAMCCACFLFQHWHCTRKLVSLLSSLENLVRKIIVVKLQITYFLPPMDKNVIWEVGGFSIKMANFQFFSEIFLYLCSECTMISLNWPAAIFTGKNISGEIFYSVLAEWEAFWHWQEGRHQQEALAGKGCRGSKSISRDRNPSKWSHWQVFLQNTMLCGGSAGKTCLLSDHTD